MSTIPIFAVPDEAVFAGPPQAQQQGETHHGQGLFPPPPTTFQGVVRTHLLRRHWPGHLGSPARVEEVVGPPGHLPPGWRLLGPWPAGVTLDEDEDERLELWLPRPLATEAVRLQSGELELRWRACWTAPQERVRPEPEGAPPEPGQSPRLPTVTLFDLDALPAVALSSGKDHGGAWISDRALLGLLRGEPPQEMRHQLPPFVAEETRVGLALDDTRRTVEPSMLYFRRTQRFVGNGGYLRSGLWARLDGAPEALRAPLQGGVATLGRRSRALAMQQPPRPSDAWSALESAAHLSLPEASGEALEAWLVLGTPAAFGGGNPGDRSDRQPWEGTPTRPRLEVPAPCEIEIRAAVLGKPLAIGGLRVSGTPKPVRSWVPAGSCWRIRVSGGSHEQRLETLCSLHHRCTLGAVEERSFGCGHTWVSKPEPQP